MGIYYYRRRYSTIIAHVSARIDVFISIDLMLIKRDMRPFRNRMAIQRVTRLKYEPVTAVVFAVSVTVEVVSLITYMNVME